MFKKKLRPNTVKQFNRFLMSFSNISRGLFVSIIGLVINFILINYKSREVFEAYVYCNTVTSFLFVLCNWGGKDQSIQAFSQNTNKFRETFNLILASRILLILPGILPVFFLPALLSFKFFIGIYLVLKVLGAFIEAVITVQKKFHAFLFVDLSLNTLLVITLLFDKNISRPEIFLAELIGMELLRTLINFSFFGKFVLFKPNLKKTFAFLKESRYFFYISLAGFLCSRADLYVVGLLLNNNELSRYFIIINLVILGQIVFNTFISTFRPNILRYNEATFKRFSLWSLRLGIFYSLFCTLAIFLMSAIYYNITLNYLFSIFIIINLLFFTLICTSILNYTRTNNQKLMGKIILFSGLFNVLMSFVCVPFLGIEGAFISNTATLIFIYILFTKYSDHRPTEVAI
ncbi:hypothetical protein CNR22_11060 [Sphingobacteriaceae bacterium]|nr:hypothetical protein CNR22_11060 [Sphingobacteriaceae bacterium]